MFDYQCVIQLKQSGLFCVSLLRVLMCFLSIINVSVPLK